LGIVIHLIPGIVRLPGSAKLLKEHDCVIPPFLMNRVQIHSAIANQVLPPGEKVKVQGDELPVKAVIMRIKFQVSVAIRRPPFRRLFHDQFRFINRIADLRLNPLADRS
jgi:hypothetical protein